jgi:hypothetical protein
MSVIYEKLTQSLVNFEKILIGEVSRDVVISLICGGVAGVAAKTAVAPAERVKMSFQISADKFTLYNALIRSYQMVKQGGVISLWKGHSTSIIRVLPFSAITYAVHDYCESKFKNRLQRDKLPFAYKFSAGSIAGAVGTLCTYPMDVLRVRLAMSSSSSWRVAISQGGLFQGLCPTMMGIIPYSGTAWMVKQTFQENFPAVFHRSPSIYEALFMNAVAG